MKRKISKYKYLKQQRTKDECLEIKYTEIKIKTTMNMIKFKMHENTESSLPRSLRLKCFEYQT